MFVEPASAAGVAGLLQAHAQGMVEPGQRIVCTVTGNGLKDPDWAISGAPAPVTIPPTSHAAAAALELVTARRAAAVVPCGTVRVRVPATSANLGPGSTRWAWP